LKLLNQEKEPEEPKLTALEYYKLGYDF